MGSGLGLGFDSGLRLRRGCRVMYRAGARKGG